MTSAALAQACFTPQSCVVAAADTVWGGLADGLRQAAGEAVTQLFTWWAGTGSARVDTTVVHAVQRYATAWIAVPIAVLAILALVAWTAGTGHPAWVTDLARGLLVLGVTAAGSIPIVAALQQWSDALARGLLDAVPTGDVGRRLVDHLGLVGVDATQVAFWSALTFLTAVLQYVLMLFRDSAVLVLTVALPIAAAGQFTRSSQAWLPRILGWLAAFLAFKPSAALIYLIGFSLLGQGDDVTSLASGLCVMAAAILALPALMRLFSFAATAPHAGTSTLSVITTLAGTAASLAQLSTLRAGSGRAPDGAVATTPADSRSTP